MLNFNPTYPSDCWEILLQQEVIGLIVESPLTKDKVGPTVLDLLNHVDKVVLFLFVEFFIGFSRRDLQLVFGFWFGGFEGARQDAQFDIF
mmetsp:Transcript_116743/g.335091  ORF Transcript_116743/g.335091 Transcript_116743/m.335091 type:complete len:90 (-) Transcript_116743:22-291(-)